MTGSADKISTGVRVTRQAASIGAVSGKQPHGDDRREAFCSKDPVYFADTEVLPKSIVEDNRQLSVKRHEGMYFERPVLVPDKIGVPLKKHPFPRHGPFRGWLDCRLDRRFEVEVFARSSLSVRESNKRFYSKFISAFRSALPFFRPWGELPEIINGKTRRIGASRLNTQSPISFARGNLENGEGGESHT